MEGKKPNLIVFVPDSWRGKDVGFLGNPVIQTPNTDALAAEGVAFSQCFVQNTVCTPSRCSFMTGWYPHVTGRRVQEHKLTAEDPIILKELRDAGYYVWCGGGPGPLTEEAKEVSCDVIFRPDRDSFDRVWAPEMSPDDPLFYSFYRGKSSDHELVSRDDAIVQGAIAFLQSNPPEPFCLFLNLSTPHVPFQIDEPYFSMYDRDALPPILPQPKPGTKSQHLDKIRERMGLEKLSAADFKEILAVYYGMITKVDKALGNLVAAVKGNGYWDTSALFVFSDHGEYAGDYCMVEKTQNTFDDSLSNVPLIIKYPASIPVPKRDKPVDALVELIDFYATVADLAGLELKETHFGKSLLPVSTGAAEKHRDQVFSEGGGLVYEPHTHEPIGTPKGKPYWPRISVQNEFPETHGKTVMVRTKTWKYVKHLYERDELYDLTADPGELNNVIDDPRYDAVKQDAIRRIAEWYLETSDVVPYKWVRSIMEKRKEEQLG